MAIFTVKNPRFVKTAVKPKDYPKAPMPEIAVVGRSNVGKSSLINHLFRVRGLARVSATPGKTQHLNFFTLNDQIYFTDLPGYGFAKVPPKVRAEWVPMIEDYLKGRTNLKLVLFLFDIRRIPKEDDIELMDWIEHHGRKAILVLTKVDKVTKNEMASSKQKILAAFGRKQMPCAVYSVPKNVGRNELLVLIEKSLTEESNAEEE